MYQVTRQDISEYKGMVIYFAKKYEKPGHPMLNRDDLIQEGWLVYARCKSRYHDKPREDFDRLLIKSLDNRMISISVYHSNATRSTQNVVDLDDQFENLGYETQIEEDNSIIDSLVKMLDENSLKVLEQLISPDPEVYQLAKIDQLRRQKLKSQGFSVKNADTIKILDEHIARFLGINNRMMSFYKTEIKIAAMRQGLAV